MAQIKFGTDGWRAVIAEDFTFANVARVAQATADYWSANPVAGAERKVVIGYDRRFFSDNSRKQRRRSSREMIFKSSSRRNPRPRRRFLSPSNSCTPSVA